MNQPFKNSQELTTYLVKNRWVWHVVFWLVYGIIQSRAYYITVLFYHKAYVEYMYVQDLAFVVMTYFTIYLYRKIFVAQKIGLYLCLGILSWLIYLFINVSFQKYVLQVVPEIARLKLSDLYLNRLSYHIMIFVFITMLKYFKDNFITQYYNNEKKQLQMQNELQNLKAQISPHFLFNTMNNFYGLAVEQSKKLPDLMIRLSELLRYSLYETNNQSVPIENEIAYLKNYIELEKIRLEDNLVVEFNTKIEQLHNYRIAPLILMVFIENAFKHAKSVKDNPIIIKINCLLEKNGYLIFSVENNFYNEKTENNHSGLGLNNVKKRLDLLYPKPLHVLEIKQIQDFFKVRLEIQLKDEHNES